MHTTPTPRKPHGSLTRPRGLRRALLLCACAPTTACAPPTPHPAVQRVEGAARALMSQDLPTLWSLLDDASRQELTRRLSPTAPPPLTPSPETLKAVFAVSLDWRQERLSSSPARFLDPSSPSATEGPAVELSLAGERWRVPVVWVIGGEGEGVGVGEGEGEWRVRLFEAKPAPQ